MTDRAEIIARTLVDYDWVNSLVDPRVDRSEESRKKIIDGEWPYYTGQAHGIIAALAAAGLKIVGREPTEAMLDAARGIYDLVRTPNSDWFRAMFDAAPPLDAGDGE